MAKFKKMLIKIVAICSAPFYYIKICCMRKKNESMVVIVPKLGDMVYAMLYVQEFKKENNRKIAVYCSSRLANFVKTYNCVDRIITHPNRYFYEPMLYAMEHIKFTFKRKNLSKKIILTVPPPSFFHHKNSCDIYRDLIFDVKNDKWQLLKLNNGTISNEIQLFEQNKDKIIIINCYSNSHVKDARNVMQKVANELLSRGYIIYSNVVGDQKPLSHTLPIHSSIEDLYETCNHIKAFISIRSGLVDTLLATNCKKFVLYQERNLLNHHSIEKFNTNIFEYESILKDCSKDFTSFILKNL